MSSRAGGEIVNKQQLDARMEYAESILRTLGKTVPTIAVESLLSDYEADDREEILESIQAYADIRARQAIFAIEQAARTSPTSDDAKPVGEAFYDGASNEPVLMWVYDGYKPAPNHVVLIAATAQPAKEAVADTSADYDIESLMDRWGIPSHLRDRFRSPMRKLVVCKKQDVAAIVSAKREGK
jgi:hypothetical protein